MKIKVLPRSFYIDDTPYIAKKLLGQLLVTSVEDKLVIGMIIQTEAYRSDDPASHSYRGKTERNASMFGPRGHAYVYRSYGIHTCFNVVARSHHYPSGGVLIRSLHPIQGITIMRQRRGNAPDQHLSNGPGKLTQAMAIHLTHDGIDLTDPTSLIRIAEGTSIKSSEIQTGPRYRDLKGY